MFKQNLILVNKPSGLTPLQLLDKLRTKFPELLKSKLSYAGRLDPMAEGLMLILVDEANQKRDQYLHLDKEYIFDCLFGFSTDTYDSLGLITKTPLNSPEINPQILKEKINNLTKITVQPYPPFSSKPVNGKPLFMWAKSGQLDQIKIPEKKIQIHKASLLKIYHIKKEELFPIIKQKINSVEGDFRQTDILKTWENTLNNQTNPTYQIAQIKIKCTSGTYVRSICHQLGKEIGSRALALNIKRTQIGKYKLKDALKV